MLLGPERSLCLLTASKFHPTSSQAPNKLNLTCFSNSSSYRTRRPLSERAPLYLSYAVWLMPPPPAPAPSHPVVPTAHPAFLLEATQALPPSELAALLTTTELWGVGGSRLLRFTFLVHLAAACLYVCLFHCVESYYQVGKVVEPFLLLTVPPVDEVLTPVLRNE